MKHLLAVILLAAAADAGAETSLYSMPIGDEARSERLVDLKLDGITDTATGELIDPAGLAARLNDTGLLFIGETHTHLDFHKVQLQTIQALHAAGREVLVGLEMFPYTQQKSLDRWVDKPSYSEADFVREADWYAWWGYNWEYYSEIFAFARQHGIRLFGVNTPREVVTAVRKKGYDDLTPEEAAHIPREILPATAEQREMYKAFFDADDALHMTDDLVDGMLRAQTVWDATMGWNALTALREHGGKDAIMVVLIGAGHVTYGLGSERQTAPYYEGNIASLVPVEVADELGGPREHVQASLANFVWGVPRQQWEVYPMLGVSLMGRIGKRPTEIIQISEGSLAERSGLQVGDVLLSLSGESISSDADMRRIYSRWRWGDVSTATIERDGETLELTVPVRRSGSGDN